MWIFLMMRMRKQVVLNILNLRIWFIWTLIRGHSERTDDVDISDDENV